jgi:aspartokinase
LKNAVPDAASPAAAAAAAAASCFALQLRASLTQGAEGPREVQVVTGFLGKGVQTGAITTLGRGGSDLTATVLGAAMELREVQVSGGLASMLLWHW